MTCMLTKISKKEGKTEDGIRVHPHQYTQGFTHSSKLKQAAWFEVISHPCCARHYRAANYVISAVHSGQPACLAFSHVQTWVTEWGEERSPATICRAETV
jgi:hypothetical protein